MQRLSLSLDLTEKDVRQLTERARSIGMTVDQLVTLSLATGLEHWAGLKLLEKDALQTMADDL